MNSTWILISTSVALFVLYLWLYRYFSYLVLREERIIVWSFLAKVSKIPALIEVMRPYVVDMSVFDEITSLHSSSMIHRYEGIYDLLEQNARIEREFLFLMKLSVQVQLLQKNEYFLYMRDFIIQHERDIYVHFSLYNNAVRSWNTFVFIKNCTLIGMMLPWYKKEKIL